MRKRTRLGVENLDSRVVPTEIVPQIISIGTAAISGILPIVGSVGNNVGAIDDKGRVIPIKID